MTSKLVTAARRKVKADPKAHRAAYLESAKAPILDHATVVELFPTVTLANERLAERLEECEAEGWKKFYGGKTKGIVGLINQKMQYRWLAVDKPRKK